MIGKLVAFLGLVAVVMGAADDYPASFNPGSCPNYPFCDNEVVANYGKSLIAAAPAVYHHPTVFHHPAIFHAPAVAYAPAVQYAPAPLPAIHYKSIIEAPLVPLAKK